MLKRLSLTNFKVFKEKVAIEPGLLTVLIGPNASGKSTIVQALAVLKQSQGQNRLVLDRPYLALGSFTDIVHARDTNKVITFELVITVDEPIEPLVPADSQFEYEVAFDSEGLRRQQGTIIEVLGRKVAGSFTRERPRSKDTLRVDEIEFSLGGGDVLGRPLYVTGVRDRGHTAKRQTLEKALEKLLTTVVRFLDNLFIVPAMRGFDQPTYSLVDRPVVDLITVEGPLEQSKLTVNTLGYRRELEGKISAWTKRIVGSRIEARLVPRMRIALEAIGPTISVNIVNEAFGTSSLVQMLLQLAVAPHGSLVAVDDPEIHLHPKAQAELTEILVDVARDENKQVMLTTHSEHILMGLLTAVAKGKLEPGELAVYFFERTNGSAKADQLPVDEKGRIEGGLRGFFEADIEQLDTYLQALKKQASA